MTKLSQQKPSVSPEWKEQKSKLKKQFPFLTDDDFNFAPDKKDALLNHLQITLGKTKGELEILLASL